VTSVSDNLTFCDGMLTCCSNLSENFKISWIIFKWR